MPRRRFYIPKDRIENGQAVLTPDQAHHLRNVLRLRPGEEVELFDGEGQGYSGTIERLAPEICIGSLERLESLQKSKPCLVLAAALIKPDRFEWMLQKVTELGVDRLIPIETQFTSVRVPAGRLSSRLERWRRIVSEAAKQSGRLTVPDILNPMPFDILLALPEYANGARLVFHEKAANRIAPEDVGARLILLCVGPEGGWSDAEIRGAQHAGFRIVSMVSQILRAETAALAAVTICRFLSEEAP